jgi:hypothetical protein
MTLPVGHVIRRICLCDKYRSFMKQRLNSIFKGILCLLLYLPSFAIPCGSYPATLGPSSDWRQRITVSREKGVHIQSQRTSRIFSLHPLSNYRFIFPHLISNLDPNLSDASGSRHALNSLPGRCQLEFHRWGVTSVKRSAGWVRNPFQIQSLPQERL